MSLTPENEERNTPRNPTELRKVKAFLEKRVDEHREFLRNVASRFCSTEEQARIHRDVDELLDQVKRVEKEMAEA